MYQGFLLIAVELWVTWVDQFVMEERCSRVQRWSESVHSWLNPSFMVGVVQCGVYSAEDCSVEILINLRETLPHPVAADSANSWLLKSKSS
ncbi:hypothetical protein QQP08_013856 [Theobroma cacao]|nr:hypothetical protein QQP08_013856 [Theobroma cacao]